MAEGGASPYKYTRNVAIAASRSTRQALMYVVMTATASVADYVREKPVFSADVRR